MALDLIAPTTKFSCRLEGKILGFHACEAFRSAAGGAAIERLEPTVWQVWVPDYMGSGADIGLYTEWQRVSPYYLVNTTFVDIEYNDGRDRSLFVIARPHETGQLFDAEQVLADLSYIARSMELVLSGEHNL